MNCPRELIDIKLFNTHSWPERTWQSQGSALNTLFKKPGIMDKPIEILRIQDIALHFIQSIKITSVSIHTNTESEKIIAPLKRATEFNELTALEKDMIHIHMRYMHRVACCLQEASSGIVILPARCYVSLKGGDMSLASCS
ncbi:MAG: hypothetical protein QXW41_07240 [Fervidicoccaceae archaeon]